ncbi:hypothetical protein [Halocalculus aciditolerans]|uniref:Uncharacterized protein n=1 Tax=Halocalculus aciditolerans TaxID=1383812 RepID=A0A830FGD7_9EURY|nr:hypothetical protein [Halocalculus aciditolerans]GGL50430.1 hypothetical protein GCM10009039_05760 [Halocalculus aciditolerans]
MAENTLSREEATGSTVNLDNVKQVTTKRDGEETQGSANLFAFDHEESGDTLLHVDYDNPLEDEEDAGHVNKPEHPDGQKISFDQLLISSAERNSDAMVQSMELESHISDISRKAVLEPLFRATAIVGAAITSLLTLAMVVAGGYPLAAVFAIGVIFCIYAYYYDLP